jgi:hypothetical protein
MCDGLDIVRTPMGACVAWQVAMRSAHGPQKASSIVWSFSKLHAEQLPMHTQEQNPFQTYADVNVTAASH